MGYAFQTDMPIAAIDVGTNTAKLVVAQRSPDGALQVLGDTKRFVRLGQGVDKTGCVSPEAMARLVVALQDLRGIADGLGAEEVFIGATSASRDAQNCSDLVATVQRDVGLDYHILTGDQEAVYAFSGALSAFPELLGQPCVVVDIGGGSTEVVGGTYGSGVLDFGTSVNVGSVRVTERCFTTQPPAPGEQDAAEAFVRHTLAEAALPRVPAHTMVGAAGTTGALARMHLGFSSWKERSEVPAPLSREAVQHWRSRLSGLSLDEVVALDPKVMRGRADIFFAGMIVLDETMGTLGKDAFMASPRGLRHGLAMHVLGLV